VLAVLTTVNALIIKTQIETGLRIGDVLALRRDQLKRQFWVTERKTGKRRHVGLTDGLREAILSGSEGSIWAFPSPRDIRYPRTRQSVWKDVKRAQKAFRLNVNVGTHTFRKVYAVRLMEQYGDIKRVQKALCHSSVTVTAIYALADELLKEGGKRRLRDKKRAQNGKKEAQNAS